MASFVLALSLALAGCAADPHLLAGQSAGRSVAVAAPVGTHLSLRLIGPFRDYSGSVAVTDWDFERAVSSAAALALQESKRYPVVKVVTGLDRNSTDFLQSGALRGSEILVLIEAESSGIGLSQRTVMGGIKCIAQVSLKGQLFDLRTGRSLATEYQFTEWQVPQSIESGPKIADVDLRDLREPMLLRASGVVERLLGKLGLR
jgi:hypothetical protein